ncbi:hypothetical protein WMO41_15320 [Ventrimonas sp. CLA-AP-H27]|uniref:Uncharacterized protein n=1 Tax=Ventrimonas faecis TaxID=3133170 RepID=A0ABV1HQA6_9FIRM
MSETFDRAWYVTIDIILFMIAMITLFLFYQPTTAYTDSAANAGQELTSDLSYAPNDRTVTVDVGNGQTETKAVGEYLTKDAVFEELMHLPRSVQTVQIGGKTYKNGIDASETDISHLILTNGMKEVYLDMTSSLYQKELTITNHEVTAINYK